MLTSKLIFFSKYNSSRRLVSLLWMALKSPTLPFRWNAFSSPCQIAVQPMERKTRLLLRSFNAKNDNHRHHCGCSILLILQFLLILLLRPSAFLVRLPRGVNTHQSPDYYSRQQMEKICFFWTQQFAFTLCRYFHHVHVLSLKFEHVPVKRRPPIPRSPISPPPLPRSSFVVPFNVSAQDLNIRNLCSHARASLRSTHTGSDASSLMNLQDYLGVMFQV
jgi:hypothetical protein